MVSWVFKLGLWTPPNLCVNQLDIILAWGDALFLPPIINHVMLSGQSHVRTLEALAKYTFGCDFYNQNMINLTKNFLQETFQARIVTHIHTKHEYDPLKSFNIILYFIYKDIYHPCCHLMLTMLIL